MTTAQFYVGLAIPATIALMSFVAIILGFFSNNKRLDDLRADMKEGFARVDARFDQVNARFDQVNARFDQVNGRIDQTNGRIDQTNGRIEKLGEDYTRFYGEQRRQDEAIETLKKRVG